MSQQTCTARSAYVLTIDAADRSAMDAKSVQTAVHDLVGMQKALLDGISQGPLDAQLVADIEHTSAVLEMAGRVVAITTESIIRRCRETSHAAKEVIRACDLNSKGRGRLAHYAPEGPDGAEAVDAVHATDINEAAEMYSRVIGSNYFTNPPEYKESYGPVSSSVQKAHSAQYK